MVLFHFNHWKIQFNLNTIEVMSSLIEQRGTDRCPLPASAYPPGFTEAHCWLEVNAVEDTYAAPSPNKRPKAAPGDPKQKKKHKAFLNRLVHSFHRTRQGKLQTDKLPNKNSHSP